MAIDRCLGGQLLTKHLIHKIRTWIFFSKPSMISIHFFSAGIGAFTGTISAPLTLV